MATSGGSGGNTTTAEAARTVYKDPSVRARLVDLCPDDFKTAYAKILFNSEYFLCIMTTLFLNIPHTGDFKSLD